jgi:hypothetical protein
MTLPDSDDNILASVDILSMTDKRRMSMLTLMTVLFLGQLTSEECLNRQFIVAQEESIHDFAVVHNLHDVLPTKQVMLIHNLGCGRYECRELATEILSEPTPKNLRAVVWGSHHKDAEIASRCESLLNKMLPCSHCLGTGRCPEPDKEPLSKYGGTGCKSCHERFTSTDDHELNTVYNAKGCVRCMSSGTSRHIYFARPKFSQGF